MNHIVKDNKREQKSGQRQIKTPVEQTQYW